MGGDQEGRGHGIVRVGDRETPWRAGLTLGDLVRELGIQATYPLARLNGKYVWRRDWQSTAVPDGAVIQFHWMVAGG